MIVLKEKLMLSHKLDRSFRESFHVKAYSKPSILKIENYFEVVKKFFVKISFPFLVPVRSRSKVALALNTKSSCPFGEFSAAALYA